jgi:hypothetical protein
MNNQDYVFYPPQNIAKRDVSKKSIFLAGTIDMGNSVDWQASTVDLIGSGVREKYNIFNPRRTDWDSSWVQDYSNPQFYQQVSWELNALETADIILFFFASGSLSPISLLELGLHAQNDKLVAVVCEDGFSRKANVEIVCDRYNIPMYKSIKDFVQTVL